MVENSTLVCHKFKVAQKKIVGYNLMVNIRYIKTLKMETLNLEIRLITLKLPLRLSSKYLKTKTISIEIIKS